jgi:3-keto-L-gulonate-6-phosphate decarboxylase
MIIEIGTALFLVQGIRIISRLIEQRRDVLHYVGRDRI